MFEAYVTNLGLYPERGAGVGEYLRFPTTAEEVQALFSRIGIRKIRPLTGRTMRKVGGLFLSPKSKKEVTKNGKTENP